MTYKKYLRLSTTNFSMKDAENFFHAKVRLAFQYYLYLGIYPVFIAAFLSEIVGSLVSDQPENNILVIFFSFLVAFAVMGNVCMKIHRKWAVLAQIFKEAQMEKCLQLDLPFLVRKGGLDLASPSYRNPKNHCAAFLIPSFFHKEFLQIRRDQPCDKISFDLTLDDAWIFKNTSECGIENIKNYQGGLYTFRGKSPVKTPY